MNRRGFFKRIALAAAMIYAPKVSIPAKVIRMTEFYGLTIGSWCHYVWDRNGRELMLSRGMVKELVDGGYARITSISMTKLVLE